MSPENIPNSTIIKDEIDNYKIRSKTWWDENGSSRPLHTMNELRVPMVKNMIFDAGLATNDIQSALPLQGVKILDAGCGGGLFSEPLAKLGATVTGIDPTEELINVAKSHAAQDASLTSLKYIVNTVEEFSKDNESKFDCVVASEVLEHITERETFLKGCVACLKPGGCLFVTTFNKTFTARIMAIWAGEYIFNAIPRGAHKYELFISPEEVTSILERYYCKTKEVKGMFMNLWTSEWYWTNPSIHYGLCAVKDLC